MAKSNWQCPSDWSDWSDWLAAGLHARNRWRLPVLLVGILFAQGRRTVTTWLRAAGVSDDYQDYFYFLAAVGRKTKPVATQRRESPTLRGSLVMKHRPSTLLSGISSQVAAGNRDALSTYRAETSLRSTVPSRCPVNKLTSATPRSPHRRLTRLAGAGWPRVPCPANALTHQASVLSLNSVAKKHSPIRHGLAVSVIVCGLLSATISTMAEAGSPDASRAGIADGTSIKPATSWPSAWQVGLARAMSGNVRNLLRRQAALREEISVLPVSLGKQDGPGSGVHGPILQSASAPYWIQVDLGECAPIDSIALVPAVVESGSFVGAGYGFPVRYRVSIAGREDFSDEVVVLDRSLEDTPNPGTNPVLIPVGGKQARWIRLNVVKHFNRSDAWVFALGEIMALRGNRNVAVGRRVTVSASGDTPPQWSPGHLTDGRSQLGMPVSREPSETNGYLCEHTRDPEAVKWVQVDLGLAMPVDEVRLVPARPTDFADDPGHGFPERFRIEVADDPDDWKPRTVFDATGSDFPNPGDNIVTLPLRESRGRVVRVTGTRMRALTIRYPFALAELQVYSGDANVAIGQTVTVLDAFVNPRFPRWRPEYLVDGLTSQHRLMELPEWLAGLDKRRRLGEEIHALDGRIAVAVDAILRRLFQLSLGSAGLLAAAGGAVFLRQRRQRERALRELRARIAADLHDEIGSQLGSIALAAQLAARRTTDPGALRGHLAEIESVARETTEAMRDIVWLLRPGSSNLPSLLRRIRETAGAQLNGCSIQYASPHMLRDRPLGIEFSRHVYLLCKEAFANIARHSQAAHVFLEFTVEPRLLSVTIRDDGVGFDTGADPGGNGLDNMRRRADELGARLVIQSAPGCGTTLNLDTPIR